MKRSFLWSRVVQEQAIGADGIFTFDLAVNPLSVVAITLRPLNDTGTLANYQNYRGIAAAMNRCSVLFRGESIINMNGLDIPALNYFRWGMWPWEANSDNVDNERRAVVVPLIMGRFPWDKKSCFPATKRGELVLELDLDIADTGYDGLRLSVDCLELLDANPSEYEKKVQITQTPAATGDNDIDLPPGNVCRGLLCFGTTGFGGAAPAPSLGGMRVMLDNQENGYANIDFEVAHMTPALWGRHIPVTAGHKHTVNAAGAGVEETTSIFDDQLALENYAFLDYDPTGDDTFALDTRGHARFHLRTNNETADALRVVPIEVIKL